MTIEAYLLGVAIVLALFAIAHRTDAPVRFAWELLALVVLTTGAVILVAS